MIIGLLVSMLNREPMKGKPTRNHTRRRNRIVSMLNREPMKGKLEFISACSCHPGHDPVVAPVQGPPGRSSICAQHTMLACHSQLAICARTVSSCEWCADAV